MEGVFTGIERAALPKRVVCSDFAATAAMISAALPPVQTWVNPEIKTKDASTRTWCFSFG
jgi:hypothetical protein